MSDDIETRIVTSFTLGTIVDAGFRESEGDEASQAVIAEQAREQAREQGAIILNQPAEFSWHALRDEATPDGRTVVDPLARHPKRWFLVAHVRVAVTPWHMAALEAAARGVGE